MTREFKTYSELDFTDDFMFCKIMTSNPELCRELLELILEMKIRRIAYPEAQKEIRHTYDGRGVRLDVYAEDDENNVYNIEMQTTLRPDLGKRIRYYQGMIDLNLIRSGERYRDLKKTYIIFICKDDPFGRNLPVYHFRSICREDRTLELKDETDKIIINACGSRKGLSAEMAAFLDYVRDSEVSSGLTEKLQEQVDRNRNREDWRVEFMTWEMELRDLRDEMREEMREEYEGILTKKIAEKDSEIAEKDSAIADKDAIIASLKAQLAQAKAMQ